jgi:subtilisin family serine protease
MSEAIMKLGELGIIFCAASGNESSDIDRDVVYPASYNNSNIITVGASTQEDKLASFSNYGKNSVDVVAPGVNILSTYPDNSYAYMHGTSMATPYVTGLIALISAYKPDLTMEEKIKIIKDSVDKKDAFSEVKTGGRVNANRAIELIDKMSSVEGEENEDSKSDNVVENTPPVAKRDYAEVTEGGSIVIHVLINDSDADGDKLVILNATEPKYGKINIYDNGIEYISNGGYVGEDSFTYKISDEKGGVAKGRVVVNVKRKKSFLWWLFN